MKKINLSIIIPTCNAKKYLIPTIKSILNSHTKNYEIIVVDNGSTDTSIKAVKNLKPTRSHLVGKIKIVALDKNFGPAKARNEGVKIAKGRYLAFLDSDTKVHPDWANQALKCFDNKKIAAIQCKLLFLKDKKRIDYVGEYLTPTGFLLPVAPHGTIDKGQFDDTDKILAAKSAGMFIRRDVFRKIDGFDEDYFIFVEETDLGWRTWLAGYQIVLCPNSIVYHHFSATKDIFNPRFNNHLVRFHGTKNYILTLYKNLSLPNLIRILPLHIFLWTGLSLYLLLTGKFDSGINIFKAILWHLPNLPKNTLKRINVQKQRKTTDQVLFHKYQLLKEKSVFSYITKFLSSQKTSITPENQ